MVQVLKKEQQTQQTHVQHVQVTIETVRGAARRASRTIDSLTDKISREVGAEADRASERE